MGMKIKLNSLGFSEIKYIRIGERLIFVGIGLVALGLLTIKNTQEWVVGTTPEHWKHFKNIHDSFKF